MNRKTIFKIILQMLVGGIVGVVLTKMLIGLGKFDLIDDFKVFGDQLAKNSWGLYIAIVLIIFVPVRILFLKGKKIYLSLEDYDEEEIDEIETKAQRLIDGSLNSNTIFMLFNFMIFGLTFTKTIDYFIVVVVLFMFNTLAASYHEITTIKFVQKMDTRLKGDPTSMKFAKEFLESCDEAQQLKIYKTAYKAFQFTKNAFMVILIFAILITLVFETSGIGVFMICLCQICLIGSYNYYALSNKS